MIVRAIVTAGLATALSAPQSGAQPPRPCPLVDDPAALVPHVRTLRPCPGVEIDLRNRAFVIPDHVVDGLPIQPALLVRWSPVPWFSLAVDNQTVDNGGPGRQGRFRVQRTVGPGGGSGNFLQETTLEIEARHDRGSAQWRFTGTASRGVRSWFAQDTVSGVVITGNRREVVPTVELHYDRFFGQSRRSALSLGAAGAFLPRHNALYLRAVPPATETFGTVVVLSGAAAVALTGTASAGVQVMLPLSGRNSVNRTSGSPVRVPLLTASLAARLTDGLEGTLLVSNTLGETGALSFVADREYPAVGAGVRFRPSLRYRERSGDPGLRPLSVVGLPPGDGADASVNLARGVTGSLAAASLGPADGLRFTAFLDHLSGSVDEGELGAAVSVRLLGGSDARGTALGVIASASRSNNLLVNLLTGNGSEFTRRGLSRSSYTFGDEDVEGGRLYIISAALPLSIDAGDAGIVWVAPAASMIQRRGVQAAGIAAGLGGQLGRSWSVLGEMAVDLSGKGNALTDSARVTRVPWTVALFRTFGGGSGSPPPLEVYGQLGTRVGNSPFHTLRARASTRPVIAFGVRLGRR